MTPRPARTLRGRAGVDPAGTLRRHLIEVTQRLMVAHGLRGLTARRIAREAEVSDGVLYNHFSDKDDLVAAAVQGRILELVDQARAAVPVAGTGPLAEDLQALAGVCLDLQTAVLPIVTGLVGQPDLLHRVHAVLHPDGAGPHQMFEPLVDCLRGEVALGRADPAVDVEAVATLLFGACQVQAFAIHLGGSDRDRARAELARSVDILVRGFQN